MVRERHRITHPDLRVADARLVFRGTIRTDVECHRCAYNLRGLDGKGRCPECGAPTHVSLAGDAIRFADPCWLGQLERGAVWCSRAYKAVGWAMVVILCWIVCECLGLAVRPVVGACLLTAALCWTMGVCFGLWLFSSPNPVDVDKEVWHAPRRLIRYAVIGVAPTAAVVLAPLTFRVGGMAWFWMLVFGSPIGLLGLVGFWGVARYGEYVSARVGAGLAFGRSRLYGRRFLISWFMAAVPTASVCAGALSWSEFTYIPASLGALGMLAYGFLTPYLPCYLARSIVVSREAAEKVWAEALLKAEGANISR